MRSLGHFVTTSKLDARRRRRARLWIAAFSLQLWITVGFALLAFGSAYATAPTYPGLWPWLFAATSVLAGLSVAYPHSVRTAAAAGATLTMVSLARIVALGSSYVSLVETPAVIIAALLWGLHVVVGLRWPAVCYHSGLRHLLDVANDRPSAPDPLRDTTGA